MCASTCVQKTPNLRCRFRKRRLTNTTRRHRLAHGQLSSLYLPSLSFSSFGDACAMLCCSAPPACSGTPSRPSECYPSMYVCRKHKVYLDTSWLSEWTLNVPPQSGFVLEPAKRRASLDTTPRRAPVFTDTRPNSNCWQIWYFVHVEREARRHPDLTPVTSRRPALPPVLTLSPRRTSSHGCLSRS